MGTRAQGGFTIIETTLFLSITGLLILMMVGGAGASLSIQRYRDSVESFKSLVQKQYSNLSSVQNSRNDNWSCSASSSVVEDGVSGDVRGQSECLLVGKYLRISGPDVTLYTILARKIGSTQTNDIAAMKQDYAMNVSTPDTEDLQLEWGTRAAWTKPGSSLDSGPVGTSRNIGILFIRSPYSGQVYTFTSNSIPAKDAITHTTFANMMAAGNTVLGQKARMVCLASDGLFASGDMGIYINPSASSSNAIETRTNDNELSVSENIKC